MTEIPQTTTLQDAHLELLRAQGSLTRRLQAGSPTRSLNQAQKRFTQALETYQTLLETSRPARTCWSCEKPHKTHRTRCLDCLARGYVWKILACQDCQAEFEWNPPKVVRDPAQWRKYCDDCVKDRQIMHLEGKRTGRKRQKPVSVCKGCQGPVPSDRVYCPPCWAQVRTLPPKPSVYALGPKHSKKPLYFGRNGHNPRLENHHGRNRDHLESAEAAH